MLKLPKNTVKLPLCAEIEARFTKTERPLRLNGTVAATFWQLSDELKRAIKNAAVNQQLLIGLERIEQLLTKEAKGLRMLQEKSGQPEAHRLSRLLLLSDDGSDRFYHDVESLLRTHGNRTWAVVIEASAETMGLLATPKGSPIRALLIADRKALEAFLADLVTKPEHPRNA